MGWIRFISNPYPRVTEPYSLTLVLCLWAILADLEKSALFHQLVNLITPRVYYDINLSSILCM